MVGSVPRRIADGCTGVSVTFLMQDRIDSAFLLAQAARCRRLADAISDCEMTAKLRELAAQYEVQVNGHQRQLDEHTGPEIIWTNAK